MTRPALLLALLLSLALRAFGQELEVLAASGARSPGSPKKVQLLQPPSVGPQGQVVWKAYLPGDDGASVYEERGGRVRRIVAFGRRPPGLPRAFQIYDAEPIGYDATGRLYLSGVAWLRNGFGGYLTIWRTNAKSKLEPLFRTNEPLPGGEPPLESFQNVAVGGAGYVAVQDGRPRIILRPPDGPAELAVSLATTPAGVGPGLAFQWVGLQFFVAADGTIAFEATLDDDVTHGIWRRAPSGEISLVARSGTEPAGAPGTTLIGLSLARMNADGKIVAQGWLLPDGASENEACLLEAEPGAPASVTARDGVPAPDAPAGSVLAGLYDPRLADDGSVTFTAAELPTPGAWELARGGIWRSTSGGIEPVVRTGTTLPGETIPLQYVSQIRRGAGGELLFYGELWDGGLVEDDAWFGVPSGGSPVRLLGDGDPLVVRRDPAAPAWFTLGDPAFPLRDELMSLGGGVVAFSANTAARGAIVKRAFPVTAP